MKKLYINLVPITVGGGLQNTINFLLNVELEKFNFEEVIFIIKNNKVLLEICEEKKYNFIVIQDSFFSRFMFETLFFRNQKNVMIFTLFGTVPLLPWGNFTVTGCAYSNLFYSEIDFWKHLTPLSKKIKLLKDRYRFRNIKSSNVVIFETDTLKNRAIKQYNFNVEHVYTVKMAVNSLVQKESDFVDFSIDSQKFNILYLGSAHPNKRQHLLIEIVENLLNENVEEICFLITLDSKSSYGKMVLSRIEEKGLGKYIINLGVVLNKQVPNLIEQVDGMINIASLESFSNNFVEAWQMEKLLLVTDADWSRDSCGLGAVYLDTKDLKSVSSTISKYFYSRSLYLDTVNNGIIELSKYPNAKDKMCSFVNIANQYTEGY